MSQAKNNFRLGPTLDLSLNPIELINDTKSSRPAKRLVTSAILSSPLRNLENQRPNSRVARSRHTLP